MEKRKTFVLLNPVAGTSDPEVVQEMIEQVLEKNEIPFVVHQTTRDDDPRKLVQAALGNGFEQFIAAGGDGTISGMANGLAGTKIPVIIVPTGTQNSFAKVLGIPLQLEDAAGWWVNSTQVRAVDAMEVDGRIYFLNISVGVSSQAIRTVKREEKRRFGILAYLRPGLQRIAEPTAYAFHFDIDRKITIHCRAKELLVANTGVLQVKDLPASPDLSIDNGKVSVCYFKVRNFWEFAWFAFRTILGRQRKPPELICLEADQEVRIKANRALPVQADGDIIGKTPVNIRLVPEAVTFLVPSRPAEGR